MTQNESYQVFAADSEEVKAIFEYLLEAFNRYLTERAEAGQGVSYSDAFMGVHNLHVNIAVDLVKRTGANQLYQAAADTFNEAMKRELRESKQLPTTERLAQALEAKNNPNLKPMIDRARQGYYDDFKSPLAAPLVQLIYDLQAAGHYDLIQRVIDGEFDATPEESEAWANSPEGQAAFDELVSGLGEQIKKRKRDADDDAT